MTLQEKFESLTTEQQISLLNNYEWNIRLNRIGEQLYINGEQSHGTFFVVYVKDKGKNKNIGLSKSPEDAIKRAFLRLGGAGWFTEDQINSVFNTSTPDLS